MTNNRLQLKASYFVYSHFLGGPLFSNQPVDRRSDWRKMWF